jgi:hypothetical protein
MTPLSRECLITFLNKYAPRIKGAVADYGGAGKWGEEVKRILASGGIYNYIALDYDTGVDLLKPIKAKRFDVGICMDLLEHTSNPFLVADNITNSLKDGAIIFVTVPFVWGLHNHPKDYFRFTVDGIKAVFSKLHCIEAEFLSDLEKPLPSGIECDIDRHWTTRVVAVFEKK